MRGEGLERKEEVLVLKGTETNKGRIWRRARALAMDARHSMQAVNKDTQVACRWCYAEKWEHYRSMGSRMVQCIQNVKE